MSFDESLFSFFYTLRKRHKNELNEKRKIDAQAVELEQVKEELSFFASAVFQAPMEIRSTNGLAYQSSNKLVLPGYVASENQSEKNYLLEASNITGTNSLTAEIKLRLLNSIYKRRFLAPNEIKAFNNMKFEINAIGRNLHQILKKIHFKEEFKTDDLKVILEQLSSKIDDTKKEIDNLLRYTNKRFKK